MCRSRRELSNEYLIAKIGFDTAENEPCKVCPLSAYRSPRFMRRHDQLVTQHTTKFDDLDQQARRFFESRNAALEAYVIRLGKERKSNEDLHLLLIIYRRWAAYARQNVAESGRQAERSC